MDVMTKRRCFDLAYLQHMGILIEFLNQLNTVADIERIPVNELSTRSTDNMWIKSFNGSVVNSFTWSASYKGRQYWRHISGELNYENPWY